MSALTLCAQLINYELLTTTMLNGGEGAKQYYYVIFPYSDVNSGRHSHASLTFLMEEQL